MSKYCLVGSCYDSKNNKYNKEILIKELGGEKLSSLIKIDRFTCKYTRLEIFSMIEKELGVSGLNNLSIRCNSNSDNFNYLRAIVDDKKFYDCILNVKEDTKTILGKVRSTNFVNRNSFLYKEEFNKLLAIINDGSFDGYYYTSKNDLVSLVNMYKQNKASTLEELSDKRRILNLISLEFSRYKTFRGWYVLEKKKRVNTYVGWKKSNPKINVTSKREKVLTIEENEALFDENFKKKYGISFEEYALNSYNSENESFLDEDEYRQMYDYDASSVVKRRR